jgi:hypothetical protein
LKPTAAIYGGFFIGVRKRKMRYPNSRYGNPEELRYYTQGASIKEIARQLKRSEKSVKQWLSFEKKVPYWVPELLRLRHMEHLLIMREMGMKAERRKLGLVVGDVIQIRSRKTTERILGDIEADLPQADLPRRYGI